MGFLDSLTRTEDTPKDVVTLEDVLRSTGDMFRIMHYPEVHRTVLAERGAEERQKERLEAQAEQARLGRQFTTAERIGGQEFLEEAETTRYGRETEVATTLFKRQKEKAQLDFENQRKGKAGDVELSMAEKVWLSAESEDQEVAWASKVFEKNKITPPQRPIVRAQLPQKVKELYAMLDQSGMTLAAIQKEKANIRTAVLTGVRYVNITVGRSLYQWDLVTNEMKLLETDPAALITKGIKEKKPLTPAEAERYAQQQLKILDPKFQWDEKKKAAFVRVIRTDAEAKAGTPMEEVLANRRTEIADILQELGLDATIEYDTGGTFGYHGFRIAIRGYTPKVLAGEVATRPPTVQSRAQADRPATDDEITELLDKHGRDKLGIAKTKRDLKKRGLTF